MGRSKATNSGTASESSKSKLRYGGGSRTLVVPPNPTF